MTTRWRSLLFIAADDHARLARVADRGADAVILDLEDAVPPERKVAARDGLPAVIDGLAGPGGDILVRINAPWLTAVADLRVAVRPDVAAIMVPKVDDTARLLVLSEMIAQIAADTGLARAPGLVALVESADGIANIDGIASVPGVVALALGSEDFALSLGVPPTPDALLLPCQLIALAAARHGLSALGLPVSIATVADTQAWEGGIAKARAMGMTGALCIHPRQVAAANDGFAPSAADIDHARRVVAAWLGAAGAGAILVDGKMVDRPVALAAARVIGHSGLGKGMQ